MQTPLPPESRDATAIQQELGANSRCLSRMQGSACSLLHRGRSPRLGRVKYEQTAPRNPSDARDAGSARGDSTAALRDDINIKELTAVSKWGRSICGPLLAPCYPTGLQRGFGGPLRHSGGSAQAADRIATAVGGLTRAIKEDARDRYKYGGVRLVAYVSALPVLCSPSPGREHEPAVPQQS